MIRKKENRFVAAENGMKTVPKAPGTEILI
jgi:hypothetical protein